MNAAHWTSLLTGAFLATFWICCLVFVDSLDRVQGVSPEAAVYARVLGIVVLWPFWAVLGVASSLYAMGRALWTFLFQRKNKEE